MCVKEALLLLFLVGVVCVDAKSSIMSDVSGTGAPADLCDSCKQVSEKLVDFIGKTSAQQYIVNMAHVFCSFDGEFAGQCMQYVDMYMPILLKLLAYLQPEELCTLWRLCGQNKPKEEVMDEVDYPEAQLQIVETLLKVCNAERKNSETCKRLVSAYMPLILTNAEQFLATRDMSTLTLDWKSLMDENNQEYVAVKALLLSKVLRSEVETASNGREASI